MGPSPPQHINATSVLTGRSHRSDSLSIRGQFVFSANCNKSPVDMRYFVIKIKTCGFPKFKRKYRGFMLTTPLRNAPWIYF
jgi:hypothetical protein